MAGNIGTLENSHFSYRKRWESGNNEIIELASRACATTRCPSEFAFSSEKTWENGKPSGRGNHNGAAESTTGAKKTLAKAQGAWTTRKQNKTHGKPMILHPPGRPAGASPGPSGALMEPFWAPKRTSQILGVSWGHVRSRGAPR